MMRAVLTSRFVFFNAKGIGCNAGLLLGKVLFSLRVLEGRQGGVMYVCVQQV